MTRCRVTLGIVLVLVGFCINPASAQTNHGIQPWCNHEELVNAHSQLWDAIYSEGLSDRFNADTLLPVEKWSDPVWMMELGYRVKALQPILKLANPPSAPRGELIEALTKFQSDCIAGVYFRQAVTAYAAVPAAPQPPTVALAPATESGSVSTVTPVAPQPVRVPREVRATVFLPQLLAPSRVTYARQASSSRPQASKTITPPTHIAIPTPPPSHAAISRIHSQIAQRDELVTAQQVLINQQSAELRQLRDELAAASAELQTQHGTSNLSLHLGYISMLIALGVIIGWLWMGRNQQRAEMESLRQMYSRVLVAYQERQKTYDAYQLRDIHREEEQSSLKSELKRLNAELLTMNQKIANDEVRHKQLHDNQQIALRDEIATTKNELSTTKHEVTALQQRVDNLVKARQADVATYPILIPLSKLVASSDPMLRVLSTLATIATTNKISDDEEQVFRDCKGRLYFNRPDGSQFRLAPVSVSKSKYIQKKEEESE